MANAEQTLRDLLGDILDKKHYKAKEATVEPITSSGANFTSKLFLVNVSSANHEDLKLFAKVGCIGEDLRAPFNADWLFGTERFVYTELVKIYEDIQDKHNLPDEHKYLFPKFYGCKSELGKETIVIENLIETGYKTYDRFESIDWEHASTAVENLARFHALSFAFEKYEPVEFYRLTPNMVFSIGSPEVEPSDEIKTNWAKWVNRCLSVTKEDQGERVRLFMAKYKTLNDYNRPIGKPVISHGDYKLSNLLFKKQHFEMAVVENVFRDLLDIILDERDYKPREVEIKVVLSGGANYTSSLFLANVSSPNRADLNLFVKVACVGENMRDAMCADWMYQTERFVYTKLINIYESIQDEQDISEEHRLVFPKFYGHNEEFGKETIVIENLIAAGYKPYNRFKNLDWEYASVAVKNLAKFHALSFAFEKYRPDDFYEMTPHMKYLVGTVKEGMEQDEAMLKVWSAMVENAVNVIKEEHKERVRSFVMNHPLLDEYNQPLGKPVIAHGDYRLSNLLFRIQNGSLQTIAVDYQTVNAGCPAADLIYFIFLGSDEEFRKEYYQQLVDHYFTSLGQALERLSVNPNVYPREKFDSDMKQMLPYAVLIGVTVLPVVTVEAEQAPTVEGDADVTTFMMEPNELYAKRFRGIVNDCIRWGVI